MQLRTACWMPLVHAAHIRCFPHLLTVSFQRDALKQLIKGVISDTRNFLVYERSRAQHPQELQVLFDTGKKIAALAKVCAYVCVLIIFNLQFSLSRRPSQRFKMLPTE